MPDSKPTAVRYQQPDLTRPGFKSLVVNPGTPEQQRLIFFERIEIGRDHMRSDLPADKALVSDQAVSARHCIITQHPDGRCFVRDVSRNGTRIDGRRVVPNIETEILPSQTLNIGQGCDLLFEDLLLPVVSSDDSGDTTMRVQAGASTVTVLVGDIQDYTQLVQEAPPRELQDSVARLFDCIERVIHKQGGTLKEYQGDAVFAYWDREPSPNHAVDACRTALALAELVPCLAEDKEVWDVPGFPLAMDWSIATGKVVVDVMGGDSPTGLSMIGEPVVLAFRLEKLIDENTGPIVVSESTWRRAKTDFDFQSMGEAEVAGFEESQPCYALRREIR